MAIYNFILRWTDDKGKDQSREYTEEILARKARTWLLERGATNVDIAVRLYKAPPLDTEA